MWDHIVVLRARHAVQDEIVNYSGMQRRVEENNKSLKTNETRKSTICPLPHPTPELASAKFPEAGRSQECTPTAQPVRPELGLPSGCARPQAPAGAQGPSPAAVWLLLPLLSPPCGGAERGASIPPPSSEPTPAAPAPPSPGPPPLGAGTALVSLPGASCADPRDTSCLSAGHTSACIGLGRLLSKRCSY